MSERHADDLAECREALAALALRCSRALDDERRRIAEGLHDDVGQTLAAALLRLHELRQADGSAERMSLADELERLVRDAIESSRALIFELRPPPLAAVGFPAVLEDRAARFTRDHDVRCQVDAQVGRDAVDHGAAELLYRVVVELLRNVAEHADAGRVTIRLAEGPDAVELSVIDDGVGITAGERPTGFGLLIARERLAAVDGTLTVRSGPTGTTVTATVPRSTVGAR